MRQTILLALLILALAACQNPLQRTRPPQGGPSPEAAVRDWAAATQGIAPDEAAVLAIQPAGRAVLVAFDYPRDGAARHALAVVTLDQAQTDATGAPYWRVGQIVETTAEERVGDLLAFHRGGTQIGQEQIFAVWGRALSPEPQRVGVVINEIPFETPLLTNGFIVAVPVMGSAGGAVLNRVEARDATGQPLAAWAEP